MRFCDRQKLKMAEMKYLEDIYFDPSQAGSFSGVEK